MPVRFFCRNQRRIILQVRRNGKDLLFVHRPQMLSFTGFDLLQRRVRDPGDV